MKATRPVAAPPKRLRARAEQLQGTTRREVAELPVEHVQKLVHELQVHQIELEMQNDQLRQTQLELQASRDRYEGLYDFAPTALLTLNAQGEILEANLQAGELLGLDRKQLLHQKFVRFVLKEAQDTFNFFCRQVFNSDGRRNAELDLENAKARRLTVQIEAVREAAIPRKQARFSLTDITKRKQAEEALRTSKSELAAIYENVPLIVLLLDGDLRVRKANKFAETFTKDRAAHLTSQHPGDALRCIQALANPNGCGFGPQCAECIIRRTVLDTLGTGENYHQVETSMAISRPDQVEALTVLLSTTRLSVQGKPHVLVTIQDITERKRMEEMLRESEAQLRLFVQQAPAAIAMFDRNMVYLAASQRWQSEFHPTPGNLIGRNHYELNPNLPDLWKAAHQKGLAGESQSCDEELWLKADGTEVWQHWSVNPWRDVHGNIGGIVILTEDISRRKQAEKAASLFQILANQSSDTFEIIDPKTSRFLDVNENGPAELGCTRAEYLSLRVTDIDPTLKAETWSQLANKIRTAGSLSGEGIHRRKDGTAFPIEFNAKWISLDRDYIVTVVRDITERKRTEERIAQLNRAKQILAGVDHAIVHISDQRKLLDQICRVAVEQGGFKLAWFGMISPDKTVRPVAKAGATGYLKGIRVMARDGREGQGPVGTAIRENRPVVIEDIEQAPSMIPWRNQARKFGLCYVAAFPIRIAGKVAGAFQVYAPKADFFVASELELLTQVSDDISYALTMMDGQTARQLAEEALRRSEQNLSVFFNQAPVGLLWLSAGGTILRANQAQLNLLGYSAEEYVGRYFLDFCAEPGDGHILLERLANKETVRNFPMNRRCKDGTIRHVLVDANSFWSGDLHHYSSIFLRDITDRVKLEKEILEITDREHRRIAQDLHDGLGQLLAGTAYLAGTLRQKLAAKSLPEARQLGRIQTVINEAIEQTRSLSRGLHPVEPEPNGLMSALQTLAARTKMLFHVGCIFHCPRPVLIRNNAVATHLFRIAQEAVTNAIRHGKPKRIEISLTETRARIGLAIKDNGRGIPSPPKKPGMGLRIMRYRARMIEGSLDIQKEPDGGTTVVCTVQLTGTGGNDPLLRLDRSKKRIKKD